MDDRSRPGPKPKRLIARLVRFGDAERADLPTSRRIHAFLRDLERVGRLVAHGPLAEPAGDLLVVRATSPGEALRILRSDPYRGVVGTAYDLLDWRPATVGAGVNLDLPPQRGAGRLTLLQRVAVVVRDQARALAWYREVLGLELRVEEPETGYVELALGKGTAALTLIEPKASWGEPYYSEALARVGGSTGIAFQTDSVYALAERLRAGGAEIHEPPHPEPWGGLALRFRDPDGNEFLAFQPEGSRRGGERGGLRAREAPDPRARRPRPRRL